MSNDKLVKQNPFSGYRARTPEELAEMFMDPNAPKTEAEHWAVREIEKQRAENEKLRAEVERLREDNERLRARVRQLEQVREAALNACADWYLSLRVDDRDSMEYVEPNRGLMESMGKLFDIAAEAKP